MPHITPNGIAITCQSCGDDDATQHLCLACLDREEELGSQLAQHLAKEYGGNADDYREVADRFAKYY